MFDHFLDALAASTNLEILELVSVLQRIQGDWVEDMVAGRNPLSLRHLKSLVLIAHPPVYTSRFLSHVLLSPAVSVRIDGYLGSVVERDVTETVSAMLPSNPAIVLPALVLAKEAVINIYEPEYSLSCSVEPRERGSHLITLLIQSSLIPQWNDFSSHHGARDLLNVLASAPLTKLDFVGDCGDVAAETWTEIFNTYPLLETLYLGITGTTKTAFTGLMDAGPTSDSPVACPRLRSVEISGPFFKKAIDVALRCLRDRAEKGYRLETISVDLWGDRRDDTLLETKYTPQLQELVTDVYCYARLSVQSLDVKDSKRATEAGDEPECDKEVI
ncbi:hypothetical protein LXA43DRAFT_1089557 [Ganoderma leucocontextum]|nr:hypothetical protein LXA43DRAFT_1089557 [Ganoderma leucocontextum]